MLVRCLDGGKRVRVCELPAEQERALQVAASRERVRWGFIRAYNDATQRPIHVFDLDVDLSMARKLLQTAAPRKVKPRKRT